MIEVSPVSRSALEARKQAQSRASVAGIIQSVFASRRHLSPLADEIGARIVSGEFGVGDALSEKMFGAERNVSRTSFREAVKVLVGKGMVRTRQNTGTLVAPRTSWNLLDPDLMVWRLASGDIDRFIQDFFVFRQSIEPLAAESAAQRRDRVAIAEIALALEEMRAEEAVNPFGTSFVAADVHFHKAIFQASANEFLVAMGQILEMPLTLSFSLHSSLQVGPANRLAMHEEVLAAIAAGNPQGARAASLALLQGVAHHVHDVVTDKLSTDNREFGGGTIGSGKGL
jgi:DNA-binding FadR family transcriptional regulator